MKNYLYNHFDPEKVIAGYDELPLWSAPFGLKLLEAVNYAPHVTVLDIGFGSGFPLIELAMRLGPDSVVYGIDPWKEAVKRAERKIACYGISNVKIMEGEAESVPLPDNSIDLITSNNGINNVTDPDKVLSECYRILKPGGQFIQTMNLDQSMFEFYTELERALTEAGLHENVKAMREHIVHKRPPIDDMKKSLQKHNFRIKKIEYDQFNYGFANGTAMLNHYFMRLAFLDSWASLVPSENADEIFDRIESRLNEYAGHYGGIKLSIPFVLIEVTKE